MASKAGTGALRSMNFVSFMRSYSCVSFLIHVSSKETDGTNQSCCLRYCCIAVTSGLSSTAKCCGYVAMICAALGAPLLDALLPQREEAGRLLGMGVEPLLRGREVVAHHALVLAAADAVVDLVGQLAVVHDLELALAQEADRR